LGSGIGQLVDCAVAVDGVCAKALERTVDEVCERVAADYPLTADYPYWLPGAEPCDQGETSPEALGDAVRRIDLFRWLAGQPETIEGTFLAAAVDACAVVTAHGDGSDVHYPTDTDECYTQEGATGAMSSSIQIAQ
jgi:hypothetical protein